jgi:hypothetical protein
MADGHISAAQLATPVVAGAVLSNAAAHAGRAPHSHGPRFLDRLGVGVSLGCAIHCIAAGLVSALPSAALGLDELGFDAEWLEILEWPFLIGAAGIGLSALIPAFRDHGSRVPLSLFAFGIALVAISRVVPGSAEIMVTVPGVIAIASAHLVNLRLCHPPSSQRA